MWAAGKRLAVSGAELQLGWVRPPSERGRTRKEVGRGASASRGQQKQQGLGEVEGEQRGGEGGEGMKWG